MAEDGGLGPDQPFIRIHRIKTNCFSNNRAPNRLKRLSGVKGKVNPGELVAKVLHPRAAILIVSENQDEQQGFFEICKGMMAAFRNPAHHSLNHKLTREDALRFCGFVDSLLGLLKQARVNPPTT